MMPEDPQPTSPVWANALLEHMCRPELYEELRGDLEEAFQDRLQQTPRFLADMWYLGSVLWLLRPSLLRRRFPYAYARGPLMWKNYLLVALRVLRKQRGYAFINVAGLAVGIACCVLIALYVHHERSYDTFHPDAANLYKIVDTYTFSGRTTNSAVVSAPMGPVMVERFPEVLSTMRLTKPPRGLITIDAERQFESQQVLFADSTFFDMLGFRLIQGTTETALTAPLSIVLTENIARTYFGNTSPLGQRIKLTTFAEREYTITGVIADPPSTTHMPFEVLVSFSTFEQIAGASINNWLAYGYHTYVRLQPGVAPEALRAKLPTFIEEHIGPDLAPKYNHQLLPITDIHLSIPRRSQLSPSGNLMYVYLFAAIAVFILLIASVNFINLTTARSVERAREVGMRKTLGAHSRQLIYQFLSESLLMSLAGGVLAMVLVLSVQPLFLNLTGFEQLFTLIPPGLLWGSVFGLALAVGVLAGAYPALVMTRFQPLDVLTGRFQAIGAGARLRKGLVVLQFAISILLIIGTFVIDAQLRFFQSHDLGFEREQVLTVPIRGAIGAKRTIVKDALLELPGVQAVTTTSSLPGKNVGFGPFRLAGGDVDDNAILNRLHVDADFGETLGVTFAAGRDFSRDLPSDSSGFILNEAAVQQLGLASADAAIGRDLVVGTATATTAAAATGPILGVVRDFNFKSLHSTVDPLVMLMAPQGYQYFAIKLNTARPTTIVEHVEQLWRTHEPAYPFTYSFLDQDFQGQYLAEDQLQTLFMTFTALALFIACLGLVGLVTFTTAQRTKEIGVRKVLGASVSSVVVLVTKDFTQLVILAVGLALPLAYLGAEAWLASFAYHTEISPMLFIGAGILALALAWGATGSQAVRAALADPVKALRHE